ncbi:MAG: hypothetical protein HOI95_27025 [Chromatiales bacterium]|jgi:hypothetical protein|nr:hypothetical protein [Chromatiales bacterium]
MQLNKRFQLPRLFLACTAYCTILGATADEIQLRDGQHLNGQFMGATSTSARIEVDGVVQDLALHRIRSILLDKRVPSGEHRNVRYVVGTGEIIRVRIARALSSSRNRTGDQFKGVLQNNILADKEVLVPAGQVIWGRVTRAQREQRPTFEGNLLLELTKMEVDGRQRPIRTTAQTLIKPAETVVVPRRGEVRVDRGAILEFRLAQPFIFRRARF